MVLKSRAEEWSREVEQRSGQGHGLAFLAERKSVYSCAGALVYTVSRHSSGDRNPYDAAQQGPPGESHGGAVLEDRYTTGVLLR